MLLMLALLTTNPQPELRERIDQFCNGGAACIEEQKQGLRHYLGMMTLYNPPKPLLELCMRTATKGKLTDWKAAASCLRKSRGNTRRR
jgi:hypothetical protein